MSTLWSHLGVWPAGADHSGDAQKGAAGVRRSMDGGGKAVQPSGHQLLGNPHVSLFPLNPHYPSCPNPSIRGRCPHHAQLLPDSELSVVPQASQRNREKTWETPIRFKPQTPGILLCSLLPTASSSLGPAESSTSQLGWAGPPPRPPPTRQWPQLGKSPPAGSPFQGTGDPPATGLGPRLPAGLLSQAAPPRGHGS